MTTLTFQNTTLSVINQNNQTWLTSLEIATALGYSKPEQSVNKLYNAHADEFTPNMTALIEMPTAGGVQEVRIFSLRGAHLIAMFARTKVAKDFRKWVLDILDKEVSQSTQQMLPPEPTINLTLSESELKKLVTTWLQFTRFRESAYFLIQAYNLRHNYGHNETSLVFNHDVCKRNIADTVALMQRLSAHLRTEPKAERAPTRLLGKF